MTVERSITGEIVLQGTCPSDDAEVLLQLLLETPSVTVDLRRCEAAHTAVIQVLMAAKPKVLGPPAAVLLERWVFPLLNDATMHGSLSHLKT